MDNTVAEKLHKFFNEYVAKSYAKGYILALPNQDPLGISFLEKGVVEQYDITPEGNKIVVNIYKPGTFFPMTWAINNTKNVHFFGALTDIEIRQASPKKVVAFLKENPDVLFDLLSRVYKGTDALLQRLVLAASGIASKRLIFELLIETYRFGKDTNDGKKVISIKHAGLAERSGLARETVSRELHKLEEEGSIAKSKAGIVIDVAVLEKQLDVIV